MPSLRKASAYSKKLVRPFTRKSGNRKDAYIKAVPASKIVKFQMGNEKAHRLGKHKVELRLVCDENIQIRDTSIEAARLLLNKNLDLEVPGQYFLKVKIYPHHVLRENKTAAGAGADRLSSGMKHSFGINIGRAAIVKKGNDILFVSAEDERVARIVRKAIGIIKSKLPCKTRIVTKEIK